MYQRKYYPQQEIKIPENYGGYALTEESVEEVEETSGIAHEPSCEHACEPPPCEEPLVEEECTSTFGSHPWEHEPTRGHEPTGRLPVRRPKREGLFDGVLSLCERFGLHMPSFDFEDLLLIGIALSLLLSKEKDIECGLLLLALVFL